LGIEDFGIYNVVGGVVILFGFFNSAMTAGTQRFLTFELGNRDNRQLKKVFSMSLTIHYLIAIFIFILAETIGLWLLYNKLNIPAARFEAALWIFHFSILSFMITVSQVPFNAIIIAHERMNVYAYMSIIEVILKLLVVFMLTWISFDKLKLYAVLIFLVTTTIAIFYRVYCIRQFKECIYKFERDKLLFKTLIKYASWNLFGGLSVAVYNQGINILLNIFFGPVVNAARGITYQVSAAISSFTSNFQIAVNPQIVKSFATKDLTYMLTLIYKSSKYSFLLLYFISLPVLLETELILKIWLKIVPESTVFFCRLAIINILIDCLSGPLITSVQATGKIKTYQIIIGLIIIANLPLSYLILQFYLHPEITFYVSIVISVIALFARILILKKLISITIKAFFHNVLFRIILVAVICSLQCLFLQQFMEQNIFRLIIITIFSMITTLFWTYFIGLTKDEKIFIIHKIT
jgi:O-antigen/teichoic acid export membrane protein